MATATTTKKTRTKAVSADVETTEQTPVKKVKEEYKPTYVLCHSVTPGSLYIGGRSGANYVFKDYGTETEMDYYDLVDLIRKHSSYIFNPMIIVDDDRFLEDFPQVVQVYEEMYTISDLKQILALPINQMQASIAKLPEETLKSLRNLASTEVANGNIDSVKKIRVLTDVLGCDFTFLSELFSK